MCVCVRVSYKNKTWNPSLGNRTCLFRATVCCCNSTSASNLIFFNSYTLHS